MIEVRRTDSVQRQIGGLVKAAIEDLNRQYSRREQETVPMLYGSRGTIIGVQLEALRKYFGRRNRGDCFGNPSIQREGRSI